MPAVRGARDEQVLRRGHNEQEEAGLSHLRGAHRRLPRHRRHPLLPQGRVLEVMLLALVMGLQLHATE